MDFDDALGGGCMAPVSSLAVVCESIGYIPKDDAYSTDSKTGRTDAAFDI